MYAILFKSPVIQTLSHSLPDANGEQGFNKLYSPITLIRIRLSRMPSNSK